jgi:hypothetical protein
MRRALAVVLALFLAGSVARAEPPEDWFGGGEGYERDRDAGEKHGGQSSGSLRSTGDDANRFGTYLQVVRAEKYRGKRLRFSGFVKSSGVEGWAGLWMRVDGKDKTGIAFDNMMGRPVKGTTDWKKYEIVLDVPDDAEDITYGMLLAGKGQVWLDDVAFETVGKDVATTGFKTEPMDRQGEAPQGLPDEPKNTDFEK